MSTPGFFSRARIVAPADFDRRRIPPAAIAIHLCIGAAYAWSIFNPALTRIRGVVVPAADDWKLPEVIWIFTTAVVCLGLSAAVAGKWLERVGPRTVGLLAAVLWSGGYLIGAIGIALHMLPLLYIGYGVVGGCGLGLGYVSPVSTLIKWFPDRRGMAAGMAIMGFGGGAILAAPIQERLMKAYYEAPQYLGGTAEMALVTEAGRRYAEVDGVRREVVVVAPNETGQMVVPGPAGVYVVGTGNIGIEATFLTLGIAYLVIMLAAALSFRAPAEGWRPGGWVPRDVAASAARMITVSDVDPNTALRTPQFYLLWIMLCFNVTAGIGVLGVAKTMMTEVFGSALPAIVTGSFATTYVLMIGLFNMLGRFFWASMSDLLGRKRTYAIFFGLGFVLYALIPSIVGAESGSATIAPLVAFYATTMVIFTMYGGGFATIPAYLADLFGARFVGAIHGRLLTAWSTAGVLGPWAITELRQRAERRAIADLAANVSPEAFAQQFGAPLAELPLLIERKTVTLAKLFALAPSGTPDPSRTLYDSTMYLMAALLAVGFVANALVRPVDAKHHAPAK